MDSSKDFLSEIKNDANISWIAKEIEDTISQGVSMSGADISYNAETFELAPLIGLTREDNKKKKSYETTRQLNESEEVKVFLDSFEKVYVDIPSFKQSAFETLKQFNPNLQEIEFVSLVNEEEDSSYVISHNDVIREAVEYSTKYQNFIEKVNK
ncbi:TPA: hypothetical protein PC505_004206 [Morganella morganii]|uniref:hypothetical protein n=1 Tax=Proteus vulgaris TaxID=585 RepID=UPI001A19C578|nr:hypothetical protein [Proteus vulgaris]HAT1528625.1 hypothetical protein [Morganella morganii]MDM3560785.1 hypothetical protein [Proteus vulgaris]HDF2365402.1 hypothetical protein [Morganella morganii]HDF2366577.1 hypothetical protein [Morganella morganii]HDF2423964.1 hypothetical protein [Morganella morganii]